MLFAERRLGCSAMTWGRAWARSKLTGTARESASTRLVSDPRRQSPPLPPTTHLPRSMSCGDFEERPAKKRRFFVEDEPAADATFTQEPSLPDEVNAFPANALPDAAVAVDTEDQSAAQHTESAGFNADLFASFVGEQVSPDILKRLQEASGNDIERGMHKESPPRILR